MCVFTYIEIVKLCHYIYIYIYTYIYTTEREGNKTKHARTPSYAQGFCFHIQAHKQCLLAIAGAEEGASSSLISSRKLAKSSCLFAGGFEIPLPLAPTIAYQSKTSAASDIALAAGIHAWSASNAASTCSSNRSSCHFHALKATLGSAPVNRQALRRTS